MKKKANSNEMEIKSRGVNKKEERYLTENQLGVILEDVNHKFDLILEGQETVKNEIREEFNERFDKFEKRLDKFENKFDKFKNRLDRLEKGFNEFKKETNSNFKMIFKYLSRIEDEIVEIKLEIKDLKENKADKIKINDLEKRVIILEREIKREKARLA